MKKKVLCLVMAAAMLVGTPTAAFAEEFTGADGWTVEFDGDNMNSNFTSQEMADEVYGILPGDTMRMQVDVANGSDVQTDWYLSNEILRSLEEGSPAQGGAYTYTLSYYSPSGEETVLFDSDTVGGEGSSPAGEGLQQADSALGDYFYLGRLDSGASGTVALAVSLEGETQGNDYQNTLAQLQMSFAVEETAPETVVQQGEDKVIRRTVTTSPKTGDYRNMLLFSGIALAGGVVLVVLLVVMVKRRREDEKGERES